jgi:hypothetical protein
VIDTKLNLRISLKVASLVEMVLCSYVNSLTLERIGGHLSSPNATQTENLRVRRGREII